MTPILSSLRKVYRGHTRSIRKGRRIGGKETDTFSPPLASLILLQRRGGGERSPVLVVRLLEQHRAITLASRQRGREKGGGWGTRDLCAECGTCVKFPFCLLSRKWEQLSSEKKKKNMASDASHQLSTRLFTQVEHGRTPYY